eukprot:TRINITY_DN78346_c0_g1_i1.p1 TRINITY_DN78346_c0_g1~~TRINITY_DN78346_c0_g1_i1.p1  ORF type:complete len:575 (+),score=89.83 TRINITY_DN78346_c0_g1_i1:68-1792(+)
MSNADADRILSIFKTFDLNGDGSIETDELKKLLKSLGWEDEEMAEFVKTADMNGDGMIQYGEFVGWLYGGQDSSKIEAAADSLAQTCPEGMSPCRYGAGCYNRRAGHRMKYWHPVNVIKGKDFRKEACRFGSSCYRRSSGHMQRYAHPGDRNYRKGLVRFDPDYKPTFDTLLQLFNYHDPNESGQLSKDEFAETLEYVCDLSNSSSSDVDNAFEEAGGLASGYVNFARFSLWAVEKGCSLPLGISEAGTARSCHFRIQEDGGWSCGCADFVETSEGLCECGHKESTHRSATAASTIGEEFIQHWERGEDGSFKEGLVLVQVEETIAQMQLFFEQTHKTSDNWTRDRGCSIHGRSHPDCDWSCMRENSNRVPTGFRVRKVFRNQNMDLWKHYAFMRNSILGETSKGELEEICMPSSIPIEGNMLEGCNEWRTFHGTNILACRGICGSNFRLALSGTGATWKEPGSSKGSPLYGFGIYLAEMVTKSDEYADALPDTEEDAGLHGMLVVRCTGGRANVCLTNEIDKEKLKADVFDGPYHSVYGDRVKELGKPYREIVVYDKDQTFPEFLVLYERLFD